MNGGSMTIRRWVILVMAVVLNVAAQEPLRSLEDMRGLFKDHQYEYLPISPPSEEVYWHSDDVLVPVKWNKLPHDFRKSLLPVMHDSGVPAYEIQVHEDPVTREVVFSNPFGVEAARLPPERGYDPYAWQRSFFNLSAKAALSDGHRWIFDPAHVALTFKVTPNRFYKTYLADRLDAQEAEKDLMATMTMRSLPAVVTNLQLDVSLESNGSAQLELAWPAAYTDRVDLFAISDLTGPNWSLIHSGIETAGAQSYLCSDPDAVNYPCRFYAAGSSDKDTDGDTVSDAREVLVHRTDPSWFDSDGDGLSDAWEIDYAFQPLSVQGDNGSAGDPDSDGLSNLLEASLGTNPRLADSDNDQLPDGWEMQHQLEPLNNSGDHGTNGDPDNDGLSNLDELNGGTHPQLADTDLDGISDGVELADGYDPLNPASRPKDTDGDGVNDREELAIYRSNPHDASDMPQQLSRPSENCYYGYRDGYTDDWHYQEGQISPWLKKSYAIGKGWVENGVFLPDLSYTASSIYYRDALGGSGYPSGGWIYSTASGSSPHAMNMGKGWVWDNGFITDFRKSSSQLYYARPDADNNPDHFVYAHSRSAFFDDMGYGWARPGSFVPDLNRTASTVYQGVPYANSSLSNPPLEKHFLKASRTSAPGYTKKHPLGSGWVSPEGFIPDTFQSKDYYYGILAGCDGRMGYSTRNTDFVGLSFKSMGDGYLAGSYFIPATGGPSINAYDQDGDGHIDIPVNDDGQFALVDDSDVAQVGITIGDASGSHSELYGYTLDGLAFDMPNVGPEKYLYHANVPLKRGYSYTGSFRSLPDSDPDGDYTFLIAGSLSSEVVNGTTNWLYHGSTEPGVIVEAHFNHSGTRNGIVQGYGNDTGFNSGPAKTFTIHVPKVDIRAHAAGTVVAPGTEITRFHEHLDNAVLLPATFSASETPVAPASIIATQAGVSKLQIEPFAPAALDEGFLVLSVSNPDVLALYGADQCLISEFELDLSDAVDHPLEGITETGGIAIHALGLASGTSTVKLSYLDVDRNLICSDIVKFSVFLFDLTIEGVPDSTELGEKNGLLLTDVPVYKPESDVHYEKLGRKISVSIGSNIGAEGSERIEYVMEKIEGSGSGEVGFFRACLINTDDPKIKESVLPLYPAIDEQFAETISTSAMRIRGTVEGQLSLRLAVVDSSGAVLVEDVVKINVVDPASVLIAETQRLSNFWDGSEVISAGDADDTVPTYQFGIYSPRRAATLFPFHKPGLSTEGETTLRDLFDTRAVNLDFSYYDITDASSSVVESSGSGTIPLGSTGISTTLTYPYDYSKWPAEKSCRIGFDRNADSIVDEDEALFEFHIHLTTDEDHAEAQNNFLAMLAITRKMSKDIFDRLRLGTDSDQFCSGEDYYPEPSKFGIIHNSGSKYAVTRTLNSLTHRVGVPTSELAPHDKYTKASFTTFQYFSSQGDAGKSEGSVLVENSDQLRDATRACANAIPFSELNSRVGTTAGDSNVWPVSWPEVCSLAKVSKVINFGFTSIPLGRVVPQGNVGLHLRRVDSTKVAIDAVELDMEITDIQDFRYHNNIPYSPGAINPALEAVLLNSGFPLHPDAARKVGEVVAIKIEVITTINLNE